jgi:hypothetical protein
MQIDFYEEFPIKKNLEKLKLIKYKIRLFVAAKSLKEFQNLEKEVKKIKKNVVVAYWPIVKNSYWISPFSNTEDLINLFKELESIKNHYLIDLELPFKNRKMILKNLPYFLKNKKTIRKFLEKNKDKITIAQLPSSIISKLTKLIGLGYNISCEKSIMWYSSMVLKSKNKKIKNNLLKLKNKKEYSISLGTIDIGVSGTEPILSPENLEKDLTFVKKAGFKKTIIFRLGGLNKRYIKIINKFQN